MRIASALVDEIVQHAREDLPNECCGIVATRGGSAVRVYRAKNAVPSPLRFEIDPRDLIRIHTDIEQSGHEMGSMYHSHVKSPAYPSQTDVNFAQNWPGVVWLIVSLAEPDAPDLRGFRISGADIEEVPLTID
ncbi:MAG: Mov34/MPN/PAD-1 family protein [Solirubrobacterales bacterium]